MAHGMMYMSEIPRWENLAWGMYASTNPFWVRGVEIITRDNRVDVAIYQERASGVYQVRTYDRSRPITRTCMDALELSCWLIDRYPGG